MTNLRGVRIETNDTTLRYITKDISSLGIVKPFKISMRFRFYAETLVSNRPTWTLGINYGGVGDNGWQIGGLHIEDNSFGIKLSHEINRTSYTTVLTGGNNNQFGAQNTTFKWVQMEITDANGYRFRFADDASTSIPISWDTTRSQSGVNAGAEQIIQELRIGMSKTSIGIGSDNILEIDEIHLEQL